MYPFEKYMITCPYNKKGNLWSGGRHKGVDFVSGNSSDLNVHSVCEGKVVGVTYSNSGFGNYVSVDGVDNKRIFYCHLSKINVVKGQKLSEGTIIGIEGKSGNATGVHLHFEVRKSPYIIGTDVDPIDYIENLKTRRTEYTKKNGIHIFKIPIENFRIIDWDNYKKTTLIKNYANSGFFTYLANGNTIPVGTLKSIATEVESATGEDWINLSHKKQHCLIVANNKAEIILTDSISNIEGLQYAVCGIPVTLNYEDVSWSRVCVPQGWFGSELYNTKHICLSYKDDYIYLMGIETTTKAGAGATITEIWKKLRFLDLENIIKLDGGGSTVIDWQGKNVFVTSENRQVNNLIYFDD